jgi:hypothetical protein
MNNINRDVCFGTDSRNADYCLQDVVDKVFVDESEWTRRCIVSAHIENRESR